MSTYTSILRLTTYYKRNGFAATARRFSLAVKRAMFSNCMVLYYCDPSDEPSTAADPPNSLEVERKRCAEELSSLDLQAMTNFWNPQLARQHMKERFDRGAMLWLAKSQGRLAGYGWTLQGQTMEPHYFPLGQNDVHFFDFQVFPQYRGRGINPFLVGQILQNLATEDGMGRAFIEAAEWNQPQLSSLKKTSFRRLGHGRKIQVLRHTTVWWDTATRNKVLPAANSSASLCPRSSGR